MPWYSALSPCSSQCRFLSSTSQGLPVLLGRVFSSVSTELPGEVRVSLAPPVISDGSSNLDPIRLLLDVVSVHCGVHGAGRRLAGSPLARRHPRALTRPSAASLPEPCRSGEGDGFRAATQTRLCSQAPQPCPRAPLLCPHLEWRGPQDPFTSASTHWGAFLSPAPSAFQSKGLCFAYDTFVPVS